MVSIMTVYAGDVGELGGYVSWETGRREHFNLSLLFNLLTTNAGGVLYLGGSNQSFIWNHSHLIIRWCA